jgi:hypothetical protein
MMLVSDVRSSVHDEPVATGERRRGLRIQQERPVKIYVPAAGRYVGGRTRDVSSTGLRIELPLSTFIREGKLITIHVGPSDTGQTLANRRRMIPAKVVWIDRSSAATPNRLLAGLEFVSSIAAHLDAA